MEFRTDPVLRLLPAQVPDTFLLLSAEEQAWRGRYFLMAWVLNGQNVEHAWWAALADDPDHNREAKAAVENSFDEAIIEGVQIANEEMAARSVAHASVQ